jgi:hypothetical protein
MPERPRPDIDQTREALRRHDERVAEDPAEPEPAEEPDASEEPGADEADEEDEG